MDAKRYTQSQVLYGLREAWETATGVDDPFDADTQIYAYMLADGSWDDLDLADVFHGIEKFFNFTCSMDEWRELFNFDVGKRDFDEWKRDVAPNLTFGTLARFVADRAPVVASFDPIPILGRHCATAGSLLVYSASRKVRRPSIPDSHPARASSMWCKATNSISSGRNCAG